MCLVALAIDESHRFPLVVAANRDEFFSRPAARLGWWSAAPGMPDILGGRDLESGGTWLGLTAAGRLALVTNVRQPDRVEPQAPSRGEIVPLWLRGDLGTDRFWTRVALSGYNGFNLIAADFRNGECFWASNQRPHPMRLERGVYGLSNAVIDTPWPKVVVLKTKLRAALPTAESAAALASTLFEALSDRSLAPDERLPSTGVPLDVERELSAAFIRTPDQSYGTRCSTIIITERARRRLVTHVFERTYTVGSALALMRQSALKDWPPRYTEGAVVRPIAQAEVVESSDTTMPEIVIAQTRKRVRSLLKPVAPRRTRAASALRTLTEGA
jgi:uncharacterized protein with NRDE domain